MQLFVGSKEGKDSFLVQWFLTMPGGVLHIQLSGTSTVFSPWRLLYLWVHCFLVLKIVVKLFCFFCFFVGNDGKKGGWVGGLVGRGACFVFLSRWDSLILQRSQNLLTLFNMPTLGDRSQTF